MERTVKINIDMERISTPRVELRLAIGRLAIYGETYTEVIITNDGNDHLVAYYRRDPADQPFIIGAVWRAEDGAYSYHS